MEETDEPRQPPEDEALVLCDVRSAVISKTSAKITTRRLPRVSITRGPSPACAAMSM
jgi:hypothetical protein